MVSRSTVDARTERVWAELAQVPDPEIPAISVVDLGVIGVEVRVTFDPPWTRDRITPAGRERLRLSGFAPPKATSGPELIGLDELAVMPIAECPYCGSRNTTLGNAFGPTLCRAIYHCADCRQPFEQFKRI